MKRCADCGAMPRNFREVPYFARDGVCNECGSERIENVIARPRYTNVPLLGMFWQAPEVKPHDLLG